MWIGSSDGNLLQGEVMEGESEESYSFAELCLRKYW